MQTDRIERMERRTERLERRVDRIERVLPTLATKADLKATEERMRTHIASSIRESEERTRTHFDVVAESLRHDIRIVAEAVVTRSERGQ